jgi:hypothetical protein
MCETETCEANLARIELRKTTEVGEDADTLIINTDRIIAITAGQNATELQMADGRTQWVRETPDEVAALAKSAWMIGAREATHFCREETKETCRRYVSMTKE